MSISDYLNLNKPTQASGRQMLLFLVVIFVIYYILTANFLPTLFMVTLSDASEARLPVSFMPQTFKVFLIPLDGSPRIEVTPNVGYREVPNGKYRLQVHYYESSISEEDAMLLYNEEITLRGNMNESRDIILKNIDIRYVIHVAPLDFEYVGGLWDKVVIKKRP